MLSPSWRCQVRSARALWRTGHHCSADGKWCPRDNKRDPGLKYIQGSQEYILTAFSDLLIQRHTSYLPRGEVNLAENIDRASQIRLPTARQRWGVRTQRGLQQRLQSTVREAAQGICADPQPKCQGTCVTVAPPWLMGHLRLHRESESDSHSAMSSNLGLHGLAHQAPLPMKFSRQEYWTECHFLPQGIFWPRDWTQVSCISCTGGQILYHWTWEAWWLVDFPNNDWGSRFACTCSEYSQQPWPILYPLCL